MTKKYRYLGYGTTNSQGIAKLDHDKDGNILTNSYTGVGAGEVDFVASTDAPSDISSSSFQSEPCPVLDCSFYDRGTTGSVDSDWVNKNATLTSSGGIDGTLFSNSGDSFGTFYANKNGTSGSSWSDLYDYQADLKIEFDIVNIAGNGSVLLSDGNNPTQIVFSTYQLSANKHIIITVESTKWKVQVGEVESNWVNHNLATDFGIAFRLNDSTASIKFKNFEIYPI